MPLDATIVTFGAALSACEQRWHWACQLLQALGERRLGGNSVSYNALASACEKAMEWEASLCSSSL